MSFEITPSYQQWRDRIFTVQPEHVGLQHPDPTHIYGVILDIGMIDARDATQWAISISAFSSGEASFQPTPGGGIIGLGGDATIAKTAQEIVEIAQPQFPQTQRAETLDLPQPETVQFFFLTPSGIRVLRGTLNDFQTPTSPYWPLLEKFRFIHYFAHQISRRNPPQNRNQSIPNHPPSPASQEATENPRSFDGQRQLSITNSTQNPSPAAPQSSSESSHDVSQDSGSAAADSTSEATQLQLPLEMSFSETAPPPAKQENPILKWLHVLVYLAASVSYFLLVVSLLELQNLLGYLGSVQTSEMLLQQGDYATSLGLRYQALRVGYLLLPPVLLTLPNLWQIATFFRRRQSDSAQTFSQTSARHLVANLLVIASLSWFFFWILWSGMPELERLEATLGNGKYLWLAAIAFSIFVTVKSERMAALRNVTSIQEVINKFNFVQSRDASLQPFLKCSVKAYKKGEIPVVTRSDRDYARMHGTNPTGFVLAADKTEKFIFRYWRNCVTITPEHPSLSELGHQHFAQVTLRHRFKVMDDTTVQYIQKTWVEFTREYTKYKPHVNFSKQTDCEYPRQNTTVIAVPDTNNLPKILDPMVRLMLGITPFSLAYSLWLDHRTVKYEIDIVTEYSNDSPIEALPQQRA